MCCQSARDAAAKGHYLCFDLLYNPKLPVDAQQGLFSCLRVALYNSHEGFARRVLADRKVEYQKFASHCLDHDDAESLRFTLRFRSKLDLEWVLVPQAAMFGRIRCLRLLLAQGAPWNPVTMTHVAWGNRVDTLEVLLELGKACPWCPMAPTIAAKAGNVRFLRTLADAGCPLWTRADDHEQPGSGIPPPGTLVVSSDVACSGPVLLFAEQVGAPMTPRMESTLQEVRRCTLALACSFHRAARLGQRRKQKGSHWNAMGKVPREIVKRIATLARISITIHDLVK
jgi:hypothetical protein